MASEAQIEEVMQGETGHWPRVSRNHLSFLLAAFEATDEQIALRAIPAAMLTNWPGCVIGDTGGEEYALMLEAAGLIGIITVEAPCDSDLCYCEVGDQCWNLTSMGKAARAGK